MDGEYFSLMPYGLSGHHSLTSVGLHPAPHQPRRRRRASVCQERNLGCNDDALDNCSFCPEAPATAWPFISELARRYLGDRHDVRYVESLFSVKTVLSTSRDRRRPADDGHPAQHRALGDVRPLRKDRHDLRPRGRPVKQHKFVSAVIRCHNAEQPDRALPARGRRRFDELFDAFEIVVVNDASTDRRRESSRTSRATLHGAREPDRDGALPRHRGRHGRRARPGDGRLRVRVRGHLPGFPVRGPATGCTTRPSSGFDIVAAVPATCRGARGRSTGVQLVLLVRSAARLRAAAGVVPARGRRDAAAAGAGPLPAGAVPLHRVPLRCASTTRPDRAVGHAAANDLRFALDVIFSVTEAGVRVARALFVVIFAASPCPAIVSSIVLSIATRETAWELVLAVHRRRGILPGLLRSWR